MKDGVDSFDLFGAGSDESEQSTPKIVPMTIQPNVDAVELLKTALDKVNEGEIRAVGLAWITKDGSIGGDISAGKDNLRMWAALEHIAREFYSEIILA